MMALYDALYRKALRTALDKYFVDLRQAIFGEEVSSKKGNTMKLYDYSDLGHMISMFALQVIRREREVQIKPK